jgi:hypothetical protein
MLHGLHVLQSVIPAIVQVAYQPFKIIRISSSTYTCSQSIGFSNTVFAIEQTQGLWAYLLDKMKKIMILKVGGGREKKFKSQKVLAT